MQDVGARDGFSLAAEEKQEGGNPCRHLGCLFEFAIVAIGNMLEFCILDKKSMLAIV